MTDTDEKTILPSFDCFRCEHHWIPRTNNRPRICPKCKSAYWDVPKKDGGIVKTNAGKRPIIMSDAGDNETITPVPELRDIIKESVSETAAPPAGDVEEGCTCAAGPLWKKGDNGKRFCELCGYEEE